eukprot:4413507-Amphidinium_carterae.1
MFGHGYASIVIVCLLFIVVAAAPSLPTFASEVSRDNAHTPWTRRLSEMQHTIADVAMARQRMAASHRQVHT